MQQSSTPTKAVSHAHRADVEKDVMRPPWLGDASSCLRRVGDMRGLKPEGVTLRLWPHSRVTLGGQASTTSAKSNVMGANCGMGAVHQMGCCTAGRGGRKRQAGRQHTVGWQEAAAARGRQDGRKQRQHEAGSAAAQLKQVMR